MINREDMLELTRRMTAKRHHFVRIAGAYIDEEGYLEGTFNTNFLNLRGAEMSKCLEIAKAVPFGEANEELKEYKIPGMKPGSIWQLLYAINDTGLKNDALLMSFYEYISERYPVGIPYSIYVYQGIYDVPVKAQDKEWLSGSEEVYKYMIVAISQCDDEQNPELPEAGILYPAFKDRSADYAYVNLYEIGDAGLREVLDLC